jgi:hypothetical protein
MSLLKKNTVALTAPMMLAILAISPHPKLFSSLFLIFALVYCAMISS